MASVQTPEQHVATRHHQAQLLFVQVFSCDPAKTKPSRKLSSEWFWRTKWEKFWEVKVQKNRAPRNPLAIIVLLVKTPFWGLIPPFQTDPNQDPLARADTSAKKSRVLPIIYCWASPPRKGRAQNLLPVELHWTTCLVTLSTKHPNLRLLNSILYPPSQEFLGILLNTTWFL